MNRWIIALCWGLLLGCVDVTIPAEAGTEPGQTSGQGIGTASDLTDGTGSSAGTDTDLRRVDPREDSGQAPPPELPASCDTHCDCPAEYDCINQRCVSGDLAIYCCDQAICPTGSDCWFANGSPGSCKEP